MTTERDLDWRLASWLDDVATSTMPDTLLARSLARVEATRQRPGWLVRDRRRFPGKATGQVPVWRRRRLAVSVAVAVVAVAVVAVALGGGLVANLFPTHLVGPSGAPSIGPVPSPSAEPSPTSTVHDVLNATGSMSVGVEVFGGDRATRLVDGRVLVVHPCETAAELYDPATGTFGPTGKLGTPRTGETSTLLQDGRVLVTGGVSCDFSDGIWATAELYDPVTGTFSPTGSMHSPRRSHTATLLSDGRVLIAGGSTGIPAVASGGATLVSIRTAATEPQILKTAELYDPETGTFSATGSMTKVRVNHTATALLDGRVLLVGAGDEGVASDASAELYDPATGTFRATASMEIGRFQHTSTLLEDGRVLIAGGLDVDAFSYASAEIYDPTDGTFSPAGSMHSARQGHTATRLPDGRVLVAGGYENIASGWQSLSSVEAFDPATSLFTVIGSMGGARVDHTATLLLDGRVLIAGGTYIGLSGAVTLTSAVLYQP